MIVAPNPALDQADDNWRDRALCRETDPELFFPIGTTGHAVGTIEQAKRICSGCQVVDECLDYALATNQDSGIWGGLSEEERRLFRVHLATLFHCFSAAQYHYEAGLLPKDEWYGFRNLLAVTFQDPGVHAAWDHIHPTFPPRFQELVARIRERQRDPTG